MAVRDPDLIAAGSALEDWVPRTRLSEVSAVTSANGTIRSYTEAYARGQYRSRRQFFRWLLLRR